MAPTNIPRATPKPALKPPRARRGREAREVLIRAGSVILRARLADTPTAERIWSTLPIYSTAETWGASLSFETRAETGREPGARDVLEPGEIAFWAEEDRIVLAWGPTPLSRNGEARLPVPCNVWAVALDDVAALAAVRPGDRIAMLLAES